MICPKCSAEIADGLKFCPNCGNPLTDVQPAPIQAPQPEQQFSGYVQPPQGQQPADSYVQPPQGQQPADSYVQPPQGQQPADGFVQPPQGYQSVPGYQQPLAPYGQPPKKKSKVWIVILIIVVIAGALIAFASYLLKAAYDNANQLNNDINTELDNLDLDDLNLDLDSINSEIDELDDLNFDIEPVEEAAGSSSGSSESYDYVDVSYSGNTVTITPNGKLDGSTVLYGGKDLEGLCDYIDDEVLEEGRYINRDMFYDLVAIDVVDDSMYSEFEDIEMNLLMACALANNFHNIDVRVKDCVIDSSKPTDYNYDVVAEGKDDTWIINYKDKTVYFNNGGTEYVSDMFDDQYMVYWMIAVEEYYGIEAD